MATNTTSQTTVEARAQIALVQHEGIPTRDAERSREFYTRVLGLQVLPRPNLPSPGYKREGIPHEENARSPVGRAQLFCKDPDGHTLEFQRAQ